MIDGFVKGKYYFLKNLNFIFSTILKRKKWAGCNKIRHVESVAVVVVRRTFLKNTWLSRVGHLAAIQTREHFDVAGRKCGGTIRAGQNQTFGGYYNKAKCAVF